MVAFRAAMWLSRNPPVIDGSVRMQRIRRRRHRLPSRGRHVRSGGDAEQPCRRAAEDRDPFVVAQSRRVEHEVDLGAGPRERIVGADHDLAGTGFGDQVAQRLGREDDRVEKELAVLQIGGRILLRQRADPVGESSVSPRRTGWRRTAGSRRRAPRRSSVQESGRACLRRSGATARSWFRADCRSCWSTGRCRRAGRSVPVRACRAGA